MQTENIYIRQIIENLKEINPYMILLFGSYAYGTPHQDSDIDLLVVTNDDYMPQSFNEKTNLYIQTNSHIINIARQVPIDLLVYTLPMFQKFKELESSFSREILSKGIILYESNNKGVA
jgi:predicted nucleotidyltransferase